MRDVLTVVAAALIVLMAAALAVPPLVDWSAFRPWVDRTLSGAFGQDVRTAGPIDLRLLPTPRLRVRRVRMGPDDAASATLDATFVRAELALTPLLAGEVRVLDFRIGRAELKLPTGPGGDLAVPERLVRSAELRRDWALEDVAIQQLLVTLADPTTGRTDQAYAETVRLQAGSLAGPWRVAGETRGQPFELVLGELGPDRAASLKLAAGGAGVPRLELDGRLSLNPGQGGTLRPRITGAGRLARAARPGTPASDLLPFAAQGSIVAEGGEARLSDVVLEVGAGHAPVRLAGEGRMRLAAPGLSLALSGRRVDWPAFRRDNAAALTGFQASAAPLPIDLALKLDGVGLQSGEELSGLVLSGVLDGERGSVRSLSVEGPGGFRVRAEASFSLGVAPVLSGTASFAARDGERLGRALSGLGAPGAAAWLRPGPVEAAAEFAVAPPLASLPRFRLAQAGTTVTGTLRYAAADGPARARLDAQLSWQGLDASQLSACGPLLGLARDLDLGITVDARDVRYGGSTGGRITGRFTTDGPAVVVDGLEVRDVAGANAAVSGRLSPDGSGRIEGRLVAPRAAPLLDLFGRAWLGGLSRLVPAPVRDEPVDLRLQAERAAAPEAGRAAVRTVVAGTLGGGPFEATAVLQDGAVSELALRGSSERWWPGNGRDVRPLGGRLDVGAKRDAAARLLVTGTGEFAGLTVRTASPLRLSADDDVVEEGGLRLDGTDATPLLARLGLPLSGPVPVGLAVAISGGRSVTLDGAVSGTTLSAGLSRPAEGGPLAGQVVLGRASLPSLVSLLALGPVPDAGGGVVWPAGRFGAVPVLPFAATLAVRAGALDLGRGIVGRDASFTLETGPDGLRLSQLHVAVGEGRLRGDLAVARQGGLASVNGSGEWENLPVSALAGEPFGPGRVSARLRFGASGESPAALAANLGGTGDVTVEGLRVERADPTAPARVAALALRRDDPLASRRWQPLVSQELAKEPLVAAGPVSAAGVLSGGVLRLSPVNVTATGGRWQGSAAIDLRTLSLDLRGVLQSAEGPRGWTGPAPAVGLSWTGPAGRPVVALDPGPLVNGLATNVLARELDRVDNFEIEAAESRRRTGRVEMERARLAEEARRRRAAEPPESVPP